jgi:hypothetical protein
MSFLSQKHLQNEEAPYVKSPKLAAPTRKAEKPEAATPDERSNSRGL